MLCQAKLFLKHHYLLIIITHLTLAGCAVNTTPTQKYSKTINTSHDLTERETFRGDQTMTNSISITRSLTLPVSANLAFELITADDVLPKVLTGYGPLPAVEKTSGYSDNWNSPGVRRTVHLSDGSSLTETITKIDDNRFYSYEISDFNHPILKRLAKKGIGRWNFENTNEGVKIDWTYEFISVNRFSAIPLWMMTRTLWKGYMDVCLNNIEEQLTQRETQTVLQK